MSSLFSKKILSAFCVLSLISTSSLAANYGYDQGYACQECPCETFACAPACNRTYIGGFGGGLFSNSSHLSQIGTAFFLEASGGALAVDARGSTKKTSSGFGGVQLGYELSNCSFNTGCLGCSIAPALEIEALFSGTHKHKGLLVNPTERLDAHDFLVSFRTNSNTCLVNGILGFNSSCWCGFSPYVGGGIGATHISLKNAYSLQVDPLEEGVNHFNSRRSDCTWAFAAQVKAGVKYQVCNQFHLFAEYRYLFVGKSDYILGSTNYPNHAVTSPWLLRAKHRHFNAFAIGLQYSL